jgi:hypothetical protein
VDGAKVPRWSAPLRLREDNNGVVLVLNHASQTISFLNPAGAHLLRQIDGNTDIDSLATRLGERYPEISKADINRDVRTAIQTFIAEGYVTFGTC